MRSWIPRCVISFVFLFISLASSHGAPPLAIPFQAVLKTPSGQAITNPTQSITLALYTVAAGGASVYTETKSVPVANGLCVTTIGNGTPAAWAALPFNVPYWVGVTVGTDPEMTPRIPLSSTPYALYANSVPWANVTGVPTSLPPSGAAGGDLSGTYPNPVIANNVVDSTKLTYDTNSMARVSNNNLEYMEKVWIGEECLSHNTTGSLDAWQSFTPTNTTYLKRLLLYVGTTSGLSISPVLRIYSGEGIGGTLLRTQSITINPTLTTQVFTLSSPVYLTGGSKYTWALSTAANSQIRYVTANSYTGGRADLNAAWDYYFRTYVAPSSEVNELNSDTYASFDNGVYSRSDYTNGVFGATTVPGAAGIYGSDGLVSGAYAGYFYGDVRVTGDCNVMGTLTKGAGAFRIDHPLDPANKTLSHSFVESPDMMNIYNGNVKTDSKGRAVVKMPSWFSALNRDFRYQLTPIGTFAQAIIEKKVVNNRFVIRTDKPGVEVSWQVTGIRKDAFAKAHRIPTEEMKTKEARGTYLFPEGFPAKRVAEKR